MDIGLSFRSDRFGINQYYYNGYFSVVYLYYYYCWTPIEKYSVLNTAHKPNLN